MAGLSIHEKINRRAEILKWANRTINRLYSNLDRYKIGQSGFLKQSIKYQLQSAGGDITSVKIILAYYGKFVDMGVGRGLSIESMSANRDVYQLFGRPGRKPKKWLSKSIYAQTQVLQFILNRDYAEQISGMITESLQGNISLNF